MIGYSASFATTIKNLLNNLKQEDALFQKVFTYIIDNIKDGECDFILKRPYFEKVNKVLKYNGFDIDIIYEEKDEEDNEISFTVKW